MEIGRWLAPLAFGCLAVAPACSTLAPEQDCAGGCPPGTACSLASGLCESTAADAGGPHACVLDSDCGGALRRCDLSLGQCVACLSNADCVSGNCDPAGHRCQALNDTCASAQALDLSGGMAVVRGDTSRAQSDVKPACVVGSTAPDVVYAFTLTAPMQVVARVTPDPGSLLQPVLVLRRVCDTSAPTAQLGCTFRQGQVPYTELTADALPAGTYYLWVDGDGDSAGAFTLVLTASAGQSGESCASPRGLPLATSSIQVTGDSRTWASDSAGTCGGGGAPDVVYALELDAPHRVVAELSSGLDTYWPAVYLRRSPCGDTRAENELACASATEGGLLARPARLDVPRLEAGRYYVFVDGLRDLADWPTGGPYSLLVQVGDPLPVPANDTCVAAKVLPPPSGGVGTVSVSGDTTTALNDATGCGGTGPDLAYSIVLGAPSLMTVRVQPSTSTFAPVVYVRKKGACDSNAAVDQLGCAAAISIGGSAALTVPNVPAGAYVIWVDGAAGTSGGFTLTVELAAPAVVPGNDTCTAPNALSPTGGAVTVSGTTTGANDDYASCEFGAGAPDVVYELTVATPQSLSLDLQAATGSALQPVMTLEGPSLCGPVGPQLLCAGGDSLVAGRAVYTLGKIDVGQYFLWVDGDYGTTGPFTLRASVGPPVAPPANDQCLASPPLLVSGQALMGDTRSAGNDDQGTCGGVTSGEVVYQFVLTQVQNVKIDVVPDSSDGQLFRPVVYLRGPASACAQATMERQCRTASGLGAATSLSLASLSAGTYFVWVDGANQTAGKFTIKLQ